MITWTRGNLLDADADALVNTVNTVGVMGKGIALMFKEAFPENTTAYEAACKKKELRLGRMFVTERDNLLRPRWIINFPTKAHWRYPSRLEWIEEGLRDLRQVILDRKIRSIALPPLGSGNGGLDWRDVRPLIHAALHDLDDTEVLVFEPTHEYQNVSKRAGVENLTIARALVAEAVRRYWVLGIECTLLEVQKLAYFLERSVVTLNLKNFLDFRFKANKYGPYSTRLAHLLDGLDGSYLHCGKRLGDAKPFDLIWFEETKKAKVGAFLRSGEAKPYNEALALVSELVDGFESPLGLELLATIDWLVAHSGVRAEQDAIKRSLKEWPGGTESAERKTRLFEDRLVTLALERLKGSQLTAASYGQVN
jgi:O-acetyl-ADP-ribose deacetylase (regulator of RNase III)